ncbi:cleavage and polyadenylation specificity factor subunit 2 [Bipolaris maydis]|uniref:cleavage and polyadenylation specificity factor subunit 2 n=1 Tax=Cochliobolus heterostrophus TaxID=5016 RepID=UPI0024DB2EC5|nr:cleavage and polyadenylation specificity factor subunit 2 [Bipolaris maydis]KAJ6286829.1 cleavage and polyadenylation specificity factor subunit 2 [Bipolaris maydis]
MFNFTPLLGAQSSSPASQSLLEFDGGIQILIDVGWDEDFSVEQLKEIERHVPTLSFILLTHATTAHLGAYVHCCKNFPLFTRIPVYATNPVISLGRTLLQDLYESTPLASSIIPTEALNESAYSFSSALKGGKNPNILLQAPTAQEIADYFARINPLRYSQPHQPIPSPHSPPLNGLTITAYSAGHTLGGSIWHIQHGMESVVYAVDWNQAREHVLSGAAWLGGPGTSGSEVLEQLRRPTALICSSRNTDMVKVAKPPSKRDEALIEMIRDTVANGGTVLIPSDSSAQTWHRETAEGGNGPLANTKIYLASRTAGATMRYVRSMLEWMEEGIDRRNKGGKDEDRAKIPFDFRHVTLLERKTRVARMLAADGPRWGFSKDALRSLASDEKNLVILTERSGELGEKRKGLGRYLWDLWNQRNTSPGQDAPSTTVINASGDQIPWKTVRAAALEGDEVPLYQQFLANNAALLETSADVVDDRSSTESESSEGSGDGYRGKALNATVALQHARNKLGMTDAELGVNVLGKKGKERMFPFQAKKRRTDDFGDLIRPEDFARAEEEDNTAGEALRGEDAKKENAVGQKRRWDDLANNVDNVKATAQQKRRKEREGREGEDEESDSEPEEDPDKVEGPSKVIIESEALQIQCRIAFVDFSGLHDRRTIQQLIPLIKPRKLIFVGGEQGETLELAEISRIALNANTDSASAISVFTPTVGVLSRNMVRNLRWQNVRGMGVVAITGRLAAASLEPEVKEEADTPAKKKARVDAPAIPVSSDNNNDTPVLDVVPANMATAVRSVAQPFHLMNANGMQAEFRGEGILVVNGTVAVRKTATGQIEIDGGAYGNFDPRTNDAATFSRVRRQIYEGLAVVAGGTVIPDPDFARHGDQLQQDALELSDDSDIEVHPNVDKKSFIRAKQAQIHQEREQRRHQIKTLKYERIINDGLTERVDRLLTALKSHKDKQTEGSGASDDQLVFQAMMESMMDMKAGKDGGADRPPTPPEGVHEHIKDKPTYPQMMASLVDAVKKDIDEQKSEEPRYDLFIKGLEKEKERIQDLQSQLLAKLAELEKEEKRHITSDDLHEGFNYSNVKKAEEDKKKASTAASSSTGSKKETTVELLNAPKRPDATRSDTGQSSGADADIEEGTIAGATGDNEDDITASPLAQSFAKIKAGDWYACLQFLMQHPEILSEKETDGLLVEAFNAELDGKPKHARQCVHQGLLLQYCRQLGGRQGVELFFKRIQTKDHQAGKMFNDDVDSTYHRIKTRAAEILKERAENPQGEGAGVEQIQLHAVDPNTQINISVPPKEPTATDPEEREAEVQARQIFESFPPGLQRALESGKLDEVNKVLAKMSVDEAEEVVEKLGQGGMLSLEEGVIDATTEEGQRVMSEIEKNRAMPGAKE